MLMKLYNVLLYKIFENFEKYWKKTSKILKTFDFLVFLGSCSVSFEYETTIDFRKTYSTLYFLAVERFHSPDIQKLRKLQQKYFVGQVFRLLWVILIKCSNWKATKFFFKRHTAQLARFSGALVPSTF